MTLPPINAGEPWVWPSGFPVRIYNPARDGPLTKETHMTIGSLPRKGVGSKTVQEVRLLKTKNYGWRWDVTSFVTAQTANDGVYDGRIHQGGRFGNTRTRRGALRKIGKALR